MVGVDERLGEFLAESAEAELARFTAGCVERSAGVFFLAVASDEGRTADSDAFLELLDDLWRGHGLPEPDRRAHLDRIDRFPEMQGDEEPPGILAFAYDAVSAIYYAYAHLVSGEVENVRYCSNHVLNSAGFIDDAAGTGDRHYDAEVAAQVSDMDAISRGQVSAAAVEPSRERARELGRERLEALKTAFA